MKGNRFKQDNRGASLLAVLVLMVAGLPEVWWHQIAVGDHEDYDCQYWSTASDRIIR